MCNLMNTVEFKESLYNSIESKIGPIRDKFEDLTQNQRQYLTQIVEYGNNRAKTIASKNLAEIKVIAGFN